MGREGLVTIVAHMFLYYGSVWTFFLWADNSGEVCFGHVFSYSMGLYELAFCLAVQARFALGILT